MGKKQFYKTIIFITFLVIVSGCTNDHRSADWAYSFVVWDGYMFKICDEYVTEIGEEIGQVTKFSDMEGTYSGNFSNTYKKGTKYLVIKGISTDKAIAVKELDGRFRKAIRIGKYGEK